jgi:hypothetical protein
MKIQAKTNATFLDGMRAMKPVRGLVIVKNDTANVAGKFTTDIVEVKKINSKTGAQKTIYPKMLILDAADIQASGEGMFRLNTTKSVAYLPVADDGLDLDNDSYLEIELTSVSTSATTTVTVYGLEDTEMTGNNFEFIKLAIPAGETSKKYTVGSNDIVAVPTANIVKLTLKSNSGQTAEYLKEELSALMDIQNDIVKIDTAVVYGSDRFFVVSLKNIKDFEVETDGTLFTFYLIDNAF